MMKKLLCTVVVLFTFIGFATAQQEINVQGNAISIVGDGTNSPNLADGTDFGQVTAGASSVEQLFTIQNIGTAPLVINPTFISGSGDFIITTVPSSPIAAGNSTTLGITFVAPLTAGVYNTAFIIFNTDSDENPYQVNITAESVAPIGPEINVTGNGFDIVGDGTNSPNVSDGTDFGVITIGTSSVEHIFVIENTGTSIMTVNPTFIGGSSDFVITTPAASSVAAGGSTNLGITFNAPVTVGTFTASIFINNDDSDENPYQINISGTSILPLGPEINIQGNTISIVGDGTNSPNLADGTDFGQVGTLLSSTEQLFVIQNTGTSPLTVNPSFISSSVDFNITTAAVSPVPIGGSTTIGVTYTASATLGVSTTQLIIFNNDSDENPYQINLSGESVAVLAPEIDVTGNAVSIVGDGTNVPTITDGTDFGEVVASATSGEQLFVIENTGTAPLVVNPSFISGSGNFTITTGASSSVAVGNTTTIGVTFNAPVTAGIYTGTLVISNDDSDENPYQINLTAEVIDNAPEINIAGNGNEIINGDVTPSILDDTDFGQTDITSGTVVHTFTIQNTGSLELTLTGASPYVSIGGADPANFSVTAVPSTPIAAAGSTTFNITFNPTSLGVKVATISIANDDSDENPYTFDVQGEGIDANAGAPLLITQYYEGTAANDKWIEVTNVSNSTVLAGSYYLALYTDFFALEGTIETTAPNQSILIGTLAPGEVALYSNPSAATPGGANLGTPAISATTNVCTFDGDDVILISSTNGATAYDNRIDIMGVVAPSTGSTPLWGENTSFIKGCGTSESPTTTFDATVNSPTDVDVNDYIRLSLTEVDTALAGTNIQLGTQGVGPTEWTTAWSSNIPDRTRSVIISGTYNASDGNIISCDMTITGNLDFNSGTSNYVEVDGDLNIVGSFTIGDNETLYMGTANQNANITGVITKFETTTELNQYDFTYWGTPVANAAISTVFAGTSLGDVYYWDADEPNVIPHGGEELLGEWIVASGSMVPGVGYIALGPSGGSYPLFQTVAFTGRPNNGTRNVSGGTYMAETLDDGNEQTDFNVVGNPYPSAISADEFLTTNNVFLDETIWFWTHATANNLSQDASQYSNSDYATYNYTGGVGTGTGSPVPDGTIASGQGFVVKVIDYSPIAKFTNKMRIRNQTGQFYRGTNEKKSLAKNGLAEKDRIWLNVESKTGGATSQLLVGFMDNATDGFDQGYDGVKNGSGWISIYGTVDEKKLAIQGLPAFSQDKEVAIGFDTYIDETISYEITIDKVEGAIKESEVYLVDNVLNVVHDLNLAPYEFTMDAYEFNPTRFSLKFSKGTLGVDDVNGGKDFVVINKEDAFELRANTVINNLKVYDVMGRLLMETNPNESTFEVNTSSIRRGTVLILLASFENGSELSKKAIKY